LKNLARKHVESLVKAYSNTAPKNISLEALQFLLEFGLECSSSHFPTNIPTHNCQNRHCFSNAYELVIGWPGTFYVEGYVVKKNGNGEFQHAWCVDKKAQVLDSTYCHELLEFDYFGVPVDVAVMKNAVSKSGGKGHAILEQITKIGKEAIASCYR